MAFGKTSESTEGVPFKKYVGVGSVKVLAVNPNKAELEKLLGHSVEKEPEYLSEVGEEDKVPQARIDFYVAPDPNKYLGADNKPLETIIKVSLFVTKKYQVGATSGKAKVLDIYGRSAWATKEEVTAKAIPQYSNGPANISNNYHVAYIGEEELLSFLKTFLNVPSVDKWENGKIVGMIDNPTDAEAGLDHINDYFKGDFTELKELIALQPNNKIKILFGVKTTDDNKQYQVAYTRKFLNNRVSDYSKLDADVKAAQNSGAYANVEFECTDFHEYVVTPTNFAPTTEDPFAAPSTSSDTPW